MTENQSESQGVSVSVPIGGIATAAVLALAAAAAYILMGRDNGDESVAEKVTQKSKGGRSPMRRLGINTLITLIENDATRKVVVAALRAMARRA